MWARQREGCFLAAHENDRPRADDSTVRMVRAQAAPQVNRRAETVTIKPKYQSVRMVVTDAPERAMPEHRGKVFAVIGPFDSFSHKVELQWMLETILRGWNTKPSNNQ